MTVRISWVTAALVIFAPAVRADGNTPPTITPFTDGALAVGQAATVRFMITDKETPVGELKVAVSSSDPAALPGSALVLEGSGGTRTLTLRPVAKAAGPVTVTVKVTDAGGLSAESKFRVTITDPMGGGTTAPAWPGGSISTSSVMYFALPCLPYTPLPQSCGCGPYRCVPPPPPYYILAIPTAFVWSAYVPAPVATTPDIRTPRPVWPPRSPQEPTPTSVVPDVRTPRPVSPARSPLEPTPSAAMIPGSGTAPVGKAAERVITRTELLKDKTEADWVALYDAGFRHYWAGRYAQAAEECAAAATLKDDARAWYYLSFSLKALGETAAARDAVRYAAALAHSDPGQNQLVTEALKNVQGPAREELSREQDAVGNDRAARAALVARPKLNAPTATVAAGASR